VRQAFFKKRLNVCVEVVKRRVLGVRDERERGPEVVEMGEWW